jgi:hypothetical protein
MATLFNMNTTGPEPYYGSQNTNQQIEDTAFNTSDLFQKAMFDMINTKYGPPKASSGLAKGGGPLFGQYAEYQTVPTGVQPFAASDYSKRFLRPGINY